MAQDKIKAPPLTDAIKSAKLKDMIKFFGPGAIMASLTIGSGETFFAARGGAVFGYAILWSFVLGCFFKWVQCYTAMRYLTLTGEHPIDRWAHFPGPRGWFPFLLGALSIMCFPFWLSFLPSLLGTLCKWMFHFGDHLWWGTFWIALFISLTLAGGYNVLEKAQLTIITLMLVAILFSAFYFQPDWGAVLAGSFIPRIPDYAPWIFQKYADVAARPPWVEITVYIGAIGGGTYDYIGYVGLLREKDWGMLGLPNLAEVQKRVYELEEKGERIPLSEEAGDVKTALAWTKAPAIDSIVSFVSVILFAAGFMIGGARLLHTEQLIPSGLKLLEYQAQFLTQIHRWLLPLYDMGVFLAIAGTIYGAYEVYTRTAYECLRTVFPGLRKINIKKLRLWVCLYVGVVGLFLMWMTRLLPNMKLIDLPTPAGIIGGVMTCGLWCLAMIWTDRKYLPKPYQMRGWLVSLNWIAGLGMAFMGLKAWWDYSVDKFHSGWWGYLFLAGMVVLSMIITAIISRYYRKKGAVAPS
jgi:Mn2+/Fe2+ NRAMP family transporter